MAGGGIAGLAAAHRLARLSRQAGRAIELSLFEASERFGGKIRTDRSRGFVIEAGPDSFLTVKPDAITLAAELGLSNRLIPTAREERDVYVFARGRLRRFPEGLLLMAPTRAWPFLLSDIVTWRGKLRMGLERFLPSRSQEDESLAAFTLRRLGREALETIVEPLMAGIYAGDASRLSLRSTFPQFAELEQRHGSVIRGLRAVAMSQAPVGALTPFASFADGLEELVEALVRQLGSPILHSRTPVREIYREGQAYRVHIGNRELVADALVLATPAQDAAHSVESLDPELAGLLVDIPTASTATVTLGFRPGDLPYAPRGFGFVVPRNSGFHICATTFVSQKFTSRNYPLFLVRCFLGGSGSDAVLAEPDDSMTKLVLQDLSRITKVKSAPLFSNIYRWNKANPQYNVGHTARLSRIESRLRLLPGIFIAGASYYGVGIPDCIRSGSQAANSAFEHLRLA